MPVFGSICAPSGAPTAVAKVVPCGAGLVSSVSGVRGSSNRGAGVEAGTPTFAFVSA